MHVKPGSGPVIAVRGIRKGGARVVMVAAVAGLALVSAAGAARAQAFGAYDFAAPPSADANRVYGVDRKTGEMSACQFERPEGSAVGVTRCFARGPGAGPQAPGRYSLVSTNYRGETGVFRVNAKSGEMSICYVRDLPGPDGKLQTTILCTPQAR